MSSSSLNTVVLSLGPGAMLGLLALGLVLIYRSTATLNIAQGAMATLGAFIYKDLSVDAGLPTLVAIVASVVLVGLVGVAIHILVMRPLRNASPLTRLIGSAGVLITIQAALQLKFGSAVLLPPSFLPDGAVSLPDGITIGVDRLILIGIALLLTVVLSVVYKYTKFGIATEATATAPGVAEALGIRYELLAAGNWFIAGALAGLCGPMLAPITGLDLTTLTYLIVPALAAAAIAGFRSFPLALLGGAVIEIAETLTTEHVSAQGSSTVVIFLIIALVLTWRRRALPSRGQLSLRLPAVSSGRVDPVLLTVALVVAIGSIWSWLPSAWLTAALTSLLIAIPMLSVVVVTGFAGQISFAQFTLAGLGAMIAASLSSHYDLPFIVVVILGAVGAGIAGGILAVISLRTQGESLAILTLAASLAIYSAVLTRTSVATVHSPTLFGLDVNSISHPQRYTTLVVVVLTLLGLTVVRLRRGTTGRGLIAIRNNERAASALGIDVVKAKILACTIAGAIAGIGGALIAFESTSVTYSGYDVFTSINVTAWTVIGGVGYVTGPLAGMLFIPGGLGTQTFDAIAGDAKWLPLVGGILLILTVVANPDGVAAVMSGLVDRVRALFRQAPGTSRLPRRAGRSQGYDDLLKRARTTPPAPSAGSERPTLRVEGVSVAFGGVKALQDVSFEVRPGEVHGLIGANGAGKTTMLDIISGFTRPDTGSVHLGDRDLTRIAAWRRARAGLGRSFQGQELFVDLDVLDNIRAGHRPGARMTWSGNEPLAPSAAQAIESLELGGVLGSQVEELPYGRRQIVAIARALASTPTVLMLDEPAAGLGEDSVEEIATLLRSFAEEWGMGVLLIEHDVNLVLRVSDRVTALDFGRVIAAGTPEEVRRSPAVVEAYLGEGTTNERSEIS